MTTQQRATRRVTGMIAAAALAAFAMAPLMAQDSQPSDTPAKTRPARPRPTSPDPKPADKPVDAPPATPTKTPATPTTTQPTKSQPAPKLAAPAVPARKKPTEPGPYVERIKPADFTITINVDVKPDRSGNYDGNRQPVIGKFEFDTLAMVFPLVTETSNARVVDRTVAGQLTIDDRKVEDLKPALITNKIAGQLYHSGIRLLRFDVEKPTTCREIELELTLDYNLYQTKFKEVEAMQVGWPKGDWPAAAQSTFDPQMYIDYERSRKKNGPDQEFYDTNALKSLVKQWTRGDPKSASPAALAKYMAGRIVADFQISGNGLQFLRTGQLQGFDLQGVPETIRLHRGSEFDLASLLVAAYRMSGLPARLVIGFNEGVGGGPDNFLNQEKTDQGLRCWVEFCLYDEAKNTVNWVPVDIAKMRKNSSRPGPFDKPWAYFGTHDEMDRLIPLAYGFHPPTTVESYGAPALWGWLMTPAPPNLAYQALRFRVQTTAKRGGDSDANKPPK